MSGIVTALNLGIGVVASISLFSSINPSNKIDLFHQPTIQLPSYVYALCVLGCVFPTIVLLDAKPGHFIQLTIGSCAAFILATLFTQFMGSAFGTWASSCCIGIMANLYGKESRNFSASYNE